jgi:signal transduction histidine kinase
MTESRGAPLIHNDHFKVDASVIFQLGEHLITDAVQALVELIKNSYDADATQVLIEVDTNWSGTGPTGLPRKGRVIVSDNGSGMTLPDVQRGWLTLSNSPKRDAKLLESKTLSGRTPLGEKGLGRLGAQRLGHDIEILSIARGASVELQLAYSWDAFKEVRDVTKVQIAIEERPTAENHGTWITIYGLKSPDTWTEKDQVAKLEDGLSQLMSPYSDVDAFSLDVVIDGASVPITKIETSVMEAADLHYDISYANGEAVFAGRARLPFFQPARGPNLQAFQQIVARDKGEALMAHLRADPECAGLELASPAGGKWFVEFRETCKLTDINPRLYNPPDAPSLRYVAADPGPFRGVVDSFDLVAGYSEQTAFDNKQRFRDYIKRFAGVRVYRDGFGVRVDRDWLRFGETSTSGGSYYGLRPFNTLGYVAITARHNPQLLEKTDREGFQNTPHYQNFFGILREFVAFSDRAQAALRRSYNKFARKAAATGAGIAEDESPSAIADQLRSKLTDAERHRAPVTKYSALVDSGISAIVRSLTDLTAEPISGSAKSVALMARQNALTLQSEVHRAATAIREVDDYLASIAGTTSLSDFLSQQVADMEVRVGDLYQAAGLGITAEALSHELAHIADQLGGRATKLLRHLKGKRADAEIAAFAEFVAASTDAVRDQLSHLAPSLRYARDKKEQILMSRFLRELFAYHTERLTDRLVEFDVECAAGNDFKVQLNRGKLTQVFDNLVLNSEYWIGRTAHKGAATIKATIVQPFVEFSDTGPGVDRRYEVSLFQPFVSGKPGGEGRGLGLFIIEQLLALDGCSIVLAETRNTAGRRNTFELNFAEAVVDER